MNGPANYEIKSIEFYSDPIPLHNNQRKARVLFNASSVNEIFISLNLINLSYHQNQWTDYIDFTILLKGKIFYKEPVKVTCDINELFKRVECRIIVPVSADKFESGIYKVKCFADTHLLFAGEFCIVDKGNAESTGVPYIMFRDINLYEAPSKNIPENLRQYCSFFKASGTRYIWLQFSILNLLYKINDWIFEAVIRITAETGELIVSSGLTKFMKIDDNSAVLETGWGSDEIKTWSRGKYKMEIFFLEKLIISKEFFVFTDDNDLLEIKSEKEVKKQEQIITADKYSVNDLFIELDNFIGHKEIAESIKNRFKYIQFLRLRTDNGIKDVYEKINMNFVFAGNRGTGKSRTARLIGKLLNKFGLLSKGELTEISKNELPAGFKGQTFPKVTDMLTANKGNVILINNAAELRSPGRNDYGDEALDAVLNIATNTHDDICIILSGNEPDMKFFWENEPGFRTFFPNFYHFSDYTPDELMQFADFYSDKYNVELEPDAAGLLLQKISNEYRKKDFLFANARFISSVILQAKFNLGTRIMNSPEQINNPDILKRITKIDIENVFKVQEKRSVNLPLDYDSLTEAMIELNSLTGINEIKEEVNELVKLAEYYRAMNKDLTKSISLHAVFKGNPGTGKTTVARILAKIYQALGLLENGHLIETDREGLIAGYLGQTEIKTAQKIEEAMGGVLFIDEAYSLFSESSDGSQYGDIAVSILLKKMEDKRGDFAVICAGYSEKMDLLINSNPGLSSRFDHIFEFNDYTQDELIKIGYDMIENKNMMFNDEALVIFVKIIKRIYENRTDNFGNAREIRTLTEKIIRKQNIRIAGSLDKKLNNSEFNLIIAEDLQNIKISDNTKHQKMGF